jgi:hypothetical protein
MWILGNIHVNIRQVETCCVLSHYNTGIPHLLLLPLPSSPESAWEFQCLVEQTTFTLPSATPFCKVAGIYEMITLKNVREKRGGIVGCSTVNCISKCDPERIPQYLQWFCNV